MRKLYAAALVASPLFLLGWMHWQYYLTIVKDYGRYFPIHDILSAILAVLLGGVLTFVACYANSYAKKKWCAVTSLVYCCAFAVAIFYTITSYYFAAPWDILALSTWLINIRVLPLFFLCLGYYLVLYIAIARKRSGRTR